MSWKTWWWEMRFATWPTSLRPNNLARLLVLATASSAPGRLGHHANTYCDFFDFLFSYLSKKFVASQLIIILNSYHIIHCSVVGREDVSAPSSGIPFTITHARHWRRWNPVPIRLAAVALVTIGRCQNGVLVNRWADLIVAKASALESPHASDLTDTSLSLSKISKTSTILLKINPKVQRDKA
jgi:hypothetical protein